MSIEDRLRAAMHREADAVEPAPDGWDRISARTAAAQRQRMRQRATVAVLSMAAVVALVVGAVAMLGDDDGQRVGTVPADDAAPGPTDPPPPSTTVGDLVPPSPVPADALWPFRESPYTDPVETAEAFMRDYLGMEEPEGRVDRRDGDRATYVNVRRMGHTGRAETTVHVVDHSGKLYVTAATTEQIRVDEPRPFQLVTSPVTVAGAASAFEGNVNVEVREHGMVAGESLGSGFVTGSGGAELGPFRGTIEFRRPSTSLGALVLTIWSAEDGGLEEAAVLRIQFAEVGPGCQAPEPPPLAEDETSVAVVLTCDAVPPLEEGFFVAAERHLPRTPGVLRAALDALLAGPSDAERDAGLGSMFSEETAGFLRSVNITADGTAVVDLDGRLLQVVSGASSSTGSAVFLGQLDNTIFHFSQVQRIEYRLDGSCDAFWEALQRSCDVVERPD
jgi:hypothetical protein